MTRGDWLAATPKCPKGEVTNVPGQVCGEVLRWEAWTVRDGVAIGRWVCAAHGAQLTGVEAARRAGHVAMWFAGAA